MRNPLNQLKQILGEPVTTIGLVLSSSEGTVMIEELGGGISSAKGDATVSSRVYVRNGFIIGPAPELPSFAIDI